MTEMSNLRGKRILIVDDDPELLWIVGLAFSQAGAQVFTAADGQEGLRQFYAHQPHLVILDIMMPLLDGWQVCRRIRDVSDVPIIMLTIRAEDSSIIRGLDYGADDYVPKPFSVKVLLARARAVLRRAAPSSDRVRPTVYDNGYLAVDLDKRQVLVRGRPVELSAIEYRLLACLVQNAGRTLTFSQILEHVWGWEYRNHLEYVHVYIWHLRQKLERDPKQPEYLLNDRGVGYQFKTQTP
ncbi:MAG: response regulator transcription factor [Anaerolineae bacterium]|nr:MAG: response regulator transcription factor [Anaerolineae bacterium]